MTYSNDVYVTGAVLLISNLYTANLFLRFSYKMNKLVVEFLGTFALVLVVLVTGNAWAIGATLALAIVAGGAISGGAFNPAVATGMWMANKIRKADLIPYILAELLGAVVAYEVTRRVDLQNIL